MWSGSADNRKGGKRGWKDVAVACGAVGRAPGSGVAPGDTKGSLIVFFSLRALLLLPGKCMHHLSSKQLRRQKVMTAVTSCGGTCRNRPHPQPSEVNEFRLRPRGISLPGDDSQGMDERGAGMVHALSVWAQNRHTKTIVLS